MATSTSRRQLLDLYFSAESEEEAENLLIIKKIKRRRFWMQKYLHSRNDYGEFHRLIPELTEEAFVKYFRLSKDQFKEIHDLIKHKIVKKCSNYRRPINTDEKLAVCLKYLATGNSFRSIAFSYRLGESTVGRIVEEVSDVLWSELQPIVLPTPTMETWLQTAADFKKIWNFNNCVGAIDGKHVTIRKPIKSGSAYYNYKKNFSIVLMAVVDADYKFLIIDEGSYGRFSDGNIFANSNFGNALKNNALDLPGDSCLVNDGEKLPYVFVADEAFPLMEHLMRPYPRIELNEPKKIFNYRLSRARRTVESAFGILAARWRVYLKPFEIHVTKVDKVIKATCVLHNYLRSQKMSRQAVEEEIDGLGREIPKDQLLSARRVGFNASSTAFAIRQKFTEFFVSSAGSINWQTNSIEQGHF